MLVCKGQRVPQARALAVAFSRITAELALVGSSSSSSNTSMKQNLEIPVFHLSVRTRVCARILNGLRRCRGARRKVNKFPVRKLRRPPALTANSRPTEFKILKFNKKMISSKYKTSSLGRLVAALLSGLIDHHRTRTL